VRASELAAAAAVLGIDAVELLPYPDGHLDEIPLEELADLVGHAVADAEALVVFDEGGITGHPDHRRATAAALLAASRHRRLAVIADHVAGTLNAELGTTFVGRSADELDLAFAVDRARQRAAIACHASQSGDNPVLWRRLELLGATEHLGACWPVQHPAARGRNERQNAAGSPRRVHQKTTALGA
jgi:LmbE family N-acetylglucosaminyl deacetylase